MQQEEQCSSLYGVILSSYAARGMILGLLRSNTLVICRKGNDPQAVTLSHYGPKEQGERSSRNLAVCTIMERGTIFKLLPHIQQEERYLSCYVVALDRAIARGKILELLCCNLKRGPSYTARGTILELLRCSAR